MTHELYFQCVIATLIGNVIHILFKVLSLIKEHKISNVEFSFKGYLKDDKWVILADLASAFALVYIVDEWIVEDKYAWILGYMKSIFLFVGLTGSYVLMYFFSVASSKLQKAIDYKTTISDQTTGTLDKPTPK